jgi:hypothetical protein
MRGGEAVLEREGGRCRPVSIESFDPRHGFGNGWDRSGRYPSQRHVRRAEPLEPFAAATHEGDVVGPIHEVSELLD